MKNQEFEQRIEKYLKRQFGITIASASKRQVYEALMSTVREKLSEKKFAYEQELKKTKKKMFKKLKERVYKLLTL